MVYTLSRLAPGSYDVLLNGVVVAVVVRDDDSREAEWRVELLADLPSGERPHPFTKLEHTFGTLEAARKWLGNAEVLSSGKPRRTRDIRDLSELRP
ncbi:hypothetical protein [Microvirga arabica]|uniref:hypothetical protein n=1 Tax=Microvirga arabica TaxID=1128671 RepID=UPI00193A3F21|nr:hypothetical protein [Microvirga arabica]MBM1170062.1 hypothetical protein [Microvirga arabica]